MPNIRPISDFRNKANEISDLCHDSREPVYITKNGVGDMVVLGIDEYEYLQARLELYARLAEAEEEIEKGAEGKDFSLVAEELRDYLHEV